MLPILSQLHPSQQQMHLKEEYEDASELQKLTLPLLALQTILLAQATFDDFARDDIVFAWYKGQFYGAQIRSVNVARQTFGIRFDDTDYIVPGYLPSYLSIEKPDEVQDDVDE